MKPAPATPAIVQVRLLEHVYAASVVLNNPDNYVITQALRSVQGIRIRHKAAMLGTHNFYFTTLAVITYLFASKQMISAV
ncbi:hypothetical protein OH492_14105 [Vibrio chagasii]|nr:hypothetical protein [Vibrio chagasii]